MAVPLLLVPVSFGGALYPWTSGFVIGVFLTGVAAAVAFVVVEGKVAKKPLAPCKRHIPLVACHICSASCSPFSALQLADLKIQATELCWY